MRFPPPEPKFQSLEDCRAFHCRRSFHQRTDPDFWPCVECEGRGVRSLEREDCSSCDGSGHGSKAEIEAIYLQSLGDYGLRLQRWRAVEDLRRSGMAKLTPDEIDALELGDLWKS